MDRIRASPSLMARLWERRVLLITALVIIAFALRFIPIHTSYFFWDEAVYLEHAKLLAGEEARYEEFSIRPILLPFILSFYRFGVDLELFARFIAAGLSALAVIVAYALAREYDERAGLMAAAIVCVLPMHVLFSRSVMTDVPAAVLTAASVFFLVRSFETDFRAHMYLLSGALLGLAILMKFSSVIIVPVFAVAMLIWRRPLREFVLGSALILLSALLVMGPFFVWSALLFGSAFTPFIEGFRIIDVHDPINIGFAVLLIVQCFSLVLIGIGSAVHRAWSDRISDRRDRLSLLLIVWFFLSIAFYLFVVHRGVAKPPGIEWEVARFLIPAVVPGVVLAASVASHAKMRWLIAIGVVFVLVNANAYLLAFEDPIDREDGLRSVTKNAALYLHDSLAADAVVSADNWPVVAYYAERSVRPHADALPSDHIMSVSREQVGEATRDVVAVFSAGSWTAIVYAPEKNDSSIVTS